MKKLMDGYVGVKFRAVKDTDCLVPEGFKDLFREFKDNADRLKNHGMTPRNGGNMSRRLAQGFVVTTSGCNLGILEPDELAYILDCSLEKEEVRYLGPGKPSSEAILHHLIYLEREDAGAVIHAHDPVATADIIAGELLETAREEPYGTVALASLARETFSRDQEIIVLKNHGYVAIGPDLNEATRIVVDMHIHLMKKSRQGKPGRT